MIAWLRIGVENQNLYSKNSLLIRILNICEKNSNAKHPSSSKNSRFAPSGILASETPAWAHDRRTGNLCSHTVLVSNKIKDPGRWDESWVCGTNLAHSKWGIWRINIQGVLELIIYILSLHCMFFLSIVCHLKIDLTIDLWPRTNRHCWKWLVCDPYNNERGQIILPKMLISSTNSCTGPHWAPACSYTQLEERDLYILTGQEAPVVSPQTYCTVPTRIHIFTIQLYCMYIQYLRNKNNTPRTKII